MSNYQTFAKYYDYIMWDRSNYVIFLKNIIKKYNSNSKSILDIACWTWKILNSFNKDYYVCWVDLSENMLSIARESNINWDFFCQDMREINLDKKFDVIVNLFDSINHLVNFSDWQKVFNNSYELLNAEGIFIFDINTQYKLQKIINYKPIMYEVKKDVIFFSINDKGDSLVNWNIKFFEHYKDDLFSFSEENIEEISFPLEKIKDSLNKFKKIIIVNENNEIPDQDSERVFFICIK